MAVLGFRLQRLDVGQGIEDRRDGGDLLHFSDFFEQCSVGLNLATEAFRAVSVAQKLTFVVQQVAALLKVI